MCMHVLRVSNVCANAVFFHSLLDDFDVHVVVTVVAHGHAKVHGNRVVFA